MPVQDNTFGFALDAGPSGSLLRTSPSSLASAAPAPAFTLRATALAVQTASVDEWLAELAALVTAGQPDPRPAHEAWWTEFWERSYLRINATNAAPRGAPPPSPPPGAAVWLRAGSIDQENATRVAAWVDESGTGRSVAQDTPSMQPLFFADAFGPGAPAIRFDGVSSYLANLSTAALPAAAQTLFAVFRDAGSTGGNPGYVCCSGVLFLGGGSGSGLSTVPPANGPPTDDDGQGDGGSPVVAMLDFEGSSLTGEMVRRRVEGLGHLGSVAREASLPCCSPSAGRRWAPSLCGWSVLVARLIPLRRWLPASRVVGARRGGDDALRRVAPG